MVGSRARRKNENMRLRRLVGHRVEVENSVMRVANIALQIASYLSSVKRRGQLGMSFSWVILI